MRAISLGDYTHLTRSTTQFVLSQIQRVKRADVWLTAGLSIIVTKAGWPSPIRDGLASAHIGRFDETIGAETLFDELSFAVEDICHGVPDEDLPEVLDDAVPDDDDEESDEDRVLQPSKSTWGRFQFGRGMGMLIGEGMRASQNSAAIPATA